MKFEDVPSNSISDNRVIKASFKDCLVEDRKKFRQSKCLMPISIGQKIHEGNKFLAVIKLINTYFKACTILVDDSVQRHTMKIESPLSEDTLYNFAVEQGNKWLERNEYAYSQLTIPYKIMRWDDWLKHKNYKEKEERVNKLFVCDTTYRDAISANIQDFLSRYKSRTNTVSFDYDRAFSFCVEYLKEECSVMCLWAEEDYEFEVYPTGRNKAMSATYEKLIKPQYPNLLKSVALRFKKYGPNPSIVNLLSQRNNLNGLTFDELVSI